MVNYDDNGRLFDVLSKFRELSDANRRMVLTYMESLLRGGPRAPPPPAAVVPPKPATTTR